MGVYTGNALLLRYVQILHLPPSEDTMLGMTAGRVRTSLPRQNVRSLLPCKLPLGISVLLQGEFSWPGNLYLHSNTVAFSVMVYRPSLSAHRFRIPHIAAIIYLLFASAVASYLWWWMDRENKRRDAILAGVATSKEDDGETDKASESSPEKRQRQGDRHIRYRYVI